MSATKVGVREFRENLTNLLESDNPVAITRHGETVGYFIPTRNKTRDSDIRSLQIAAAELDALIASAGTSEEELMQDFKTLRRRDRDRTGNKCSS